MGVHAITNVNSPRDSHVIRSDSLGAPQDHVFTCEKLQNSTYALCTITEVDSNITKSE